ncbi:ATP-grasp domain-containing protein [Streptomyces sp. SID3343]|uniref:ATP-grasp domain-containing protein n=1 Tax=Streptomyces sp. SID3343 TaxID=2690260 RepID=UPI00136C9021|nr:ATP-grasp domain-containing protein [Streptomyces sp. SID3343]MYW05890.1 ATP-grasp domain-containing protein [Streptomyces sp. SID3343]
MRLYLLALNPTDSVTEGFLPAAGRLGLDVTLLTEPAHAARHRDLCAGAFASVEVLECDVRDFREVVGRISAHHPPAAVFTNSDHLQVQAALTAEYFGLPAKDWRAALRAKNKAQMRHRLAASGIDTVWSAELAPARRAKDLLTHTRCPYPCVVKPREGVAGEDVVLVADDAELVARCDEIQARRPGAALLIEEFLPGELYTLETLGDRHGTRVVAGFHTHVSPPPYFVELRLDLVPDPPRATTAAVLARLDALGVGFGACHTEFVVHDGRARIVEVNYRAIGDQCDLLLAELLEIPLFEYILRIHLGEDLPADLGARGDRHARVDYPCAARAGVLTAAPDRLDVAVTDPAGDVRRTYRPLRAIGERHEHHHSNRDYLGVLRTTGTDRAAVDRAAEQFLTGRHWRITP